MTIMGSGSSKKSVNQDSDCFIKTTKSNVNLLDPGHAEVINDDKVATSQTNPGIAESISDMATSKQDAKKTDQNPASIQKRDNLISVMDVDIAWKEVEKRRDKNPVDPKDLITRRSGWQTVRIFISSTFRDFYHEREVLMKEVFPELRIWCEKRKIQIVECDLRWGIPDKSSFEYTIQNCLDEIKECYRENKKPYFINLTSEYGGWMLDKNCVCDEFETEKDKFEKVRRSFQEENNLLIGTTVTDMEIITAAYLTDNPNAFFMIREPSFLNLFDDEFFKSCDEKLRHTIAKGFKDDYTKKRKEVIQNHIPESRWIKYECTGAKVNADKKVVFTYKDHDVTWNKVLTFFKQRIEEQYPLDEAGEQDVFHKAKDDHKAFMELKGKHVLGREDVLQKVDGYISCGDDSGHLLVVGEAGSGKSATIALLTQWHVFYHFVGAVPGSSNLPMMLSRLLKELQLEQECEDDAVTICHSALSNPYTPKIIVLVDAFNQLHDSSSSWLPRKLASNVRCIVSVLEHTEEHERLKQLTAQQYTLAQLEDKARKKMVCEYFKMFNKTLEEPLVDKLVAHSSNPLWLSLACQELKLFGLFRKLEAKITEFPSSLDGLLEEIFVRLEKETDGPLLKATLSMIQLSKAGLTESELIDLLADNLIPGKAAAKSTSEKPSRLPYSKWVAIRRVLKPFLRPYGDLGQGKFHFYHQSLSQLSSKKYLGIKSEEQKVNATCLWWHQKMAHYFQFVSNKERRIEEYPYHLVKIKDRTRLKDFLIEWDTVNALFEEELSGKLVRYWNEVGGRDVMTKCCKAMVDNLPQNVDIRQQLECYRQISHILLQVESFPESESLAVTAMDLEDRHIGGKQYFEKGLLDETGEYLQLHLLMAAILDKRTKSATRIESKNVPVIKSCIAHRKICLDIMKKTMKTTAEQLSVGHRLVQQAFSHIALSRYKDDLKKKERTDALKEAEALLDESTAMLNKLQHEGYLAEATMTRGLMYNYEDKDKAIKYLQEAEKLSKHAYGNHHTLTYRIFDNLISAYEFAKDYNRAYEYYKHAYVLSKEVYGENHPIVKSRYQEIKEQSKLRCYKKVMKDFKTDLEQ